MSHRGSEGDAWQERHTLSIRNRATRRGIRKGREPAGGRRLSGYYQKKGLVTAS
jgi:hypothetical protein